MAGQNTKKQRDKDRQSNRGYNWDIFRSFKKTLAFCHNYGDYLQPLSNVAAEWPQVMIDCRLCIIIWSFGFRFVMTCINSLKNTIISRQTDNWVSKNLRERIYKISGLAHVLDHIKLHMTMAYKASKKNLIQLKLRNISLFVYACLWIPLWQNEHTSRLFIDKWINKSLFRCFKICQKPRCVDRDMIQEKRKDFFKESQ